LKEEILMIKNTRGSVTMVAFIAMLFFSLYSIIVFSNSVRSFIIQRNSIKTIQSVYSKDVSPEKMIDIYYNVLNEEPIFLFNEPS
jgi:hypothetical protein